MTESDLRRNWPALLKRQAARNPERLLPFFQDIIAASNIPDSCAAPIFEGLVQYLLDLTSGNGDQSPSFDSAFLSSSPAPANQNRSLASPLPADELAGFILDGLDKHPFLREKGKPVADALIACGSFPPAGESISSYMAHLLRIAGHPDPEPTEIDPENLRTVSGESVRGKSAEAAMRFAVLLQNEQTEWPNLLPSILVRLAADPHPGVRIPILNRLPDLSRLDAETPWRLFKGATGTYLKELWPFGEPFLVHRYWETPAQVRSWLTRHRKRIPCLNDGHWGSEIAKAFLKGRTTEKELVSDVSLLDSETVRDEVFGLLVKHLAAAPQKGPALRGLLAWIDRIPFSPKRLELLSAFFEDRGMESIDITIPIAYKFISGFDGDSIDSSLDWLFRWIASVSAAAPTAAIQLCENLLSRMAVSAGPFQESRTDRLLQLCADHFQNVSKGVSSEAIDRILELGHPRHEPFPPSLNSQ